LGKGRAVRQAVGVTFFTAWLRKRTWTELLYCFVGYVLGVAGFVFAVTMLSVSAGLAITFIGLPLLAVTLFAARGWGAAYRALGRSLLGIQVDGPLPRSAARNWFVRWLGDKAGWRAVAFLLVQFPVAILDFVVAVTFVSTSLFASTYWIWWHTTPPQEVDGVYHRGAELTPHYFLDTPGRIAVTTLIGIAALLITPWAIRGVLTLDRLLIKALLGPTDADRRVQQLEETRAIAVEDSAAALRRIERDLHDGAQARLVALAMSLGLAKEELTGDDPEAIARVKSLIDSAHREAKDTIVELRDLARGIHPPALDRGLDEALATLAARAPLPVSVNVALPERPSPAVETIAYFCTAELLTNVTKHSGARHASISVLRGEHLLVLRVEDDGAGGAEPGKEGGSGLTGLADRIATVDGTLAISSPVGGPTSVTIEIPI